MLGTINKWEESLLRYLYIRASIEGNWNRFHVRWIAFR
jgi:hypothetical protein